MTPAELLTAAIAIFTFAAVAAIHQDVYSLYQRRKFWKDLKRKYNLQIEAALTSQKEDVLYYDPNVREDVTPSKEGN